MAFGKKKRNLLLGITASQQKRLFSLIPLLCDLLRHYGGGDVDWLTNADESEIAEAAKRLAWRVCAGPAVIACCMRCSVLLRY